MRNLLIFIKKNKFLISFIVFSFFIYSLITFPSGSYYCFNNECGIYFWGAHDHDAIWHLAIIEASFKNFPPIHPVYSESNLSGYNYFLDLIIFLITRFQIDSKILYFKIFPILWFVFYTYTTLILSEKISKNKYFKFFLLFFNYFGASFGFFLSLYHDKTIFGSSSKLAMQPLLSPTNLQFCFSLIFINLILINFFNKNSLRKNILYALYLFINFGLKFYAGLISLFLIFFLNLIEKITISKKIFSYLFIFASMIFSIFVFYNPLQSVKTGFPLIFSPFSQVNYLVEQPSLIYLPKLANAIYFLRENGFGPRLILIEIFLIILFFILHYGVRIFGLIYYFLSFFKNKKFDFHFVILSTTLFSSFLTILFVQKGEWWNTIQFTYYGLFLANILIAKFLININFNSVVTKFLIIFLLLINIPENLDIIKTFYPLKLGNFISQKEIESLNFLKNQKDGVIFSINNSNDIKNILINNAYIPAFTGKQIFIADTAQLKITGINYQNRLEKILNYDCEIFKDKISYIYEVKSNAFLSKFKKCNLKIKKIFENKEVVIYRFI
ncbi:MAG: hypothetical protein ACPLRN_03480 [Microgenomates group bacterium]